MRTNIIILTTLALSLCASAAGGGTWFPGAVAAASHQPEYTTWKRAQLEQWLETHNIPTTRAKKPTEAELRDLVAENWHSASAWTYDQYYNAQQIFADVRDTAFETWDESRLREFLLRQGIVAPKSSKEHLVLLAKSHYKGYTDAAKSFADRASATASGATAAASRTASGMASKASSVVVQAETEVAKAMDRSKDYVYSSWDDSRLRSYLESHGLLKTKAERRRDEMLAMMEEHYNKVANPVWEAWGDSYMHDWLVSHHIIKSDFEKNRDKLRAELERYYYAPMDRVWSTWTDSEMRTWLIDHDIIKSHAQVQRNKMMKMMEDNYLHAKDTFWSAWSDNQIRQWLIDHGYLRSDAQVKRDELIKLANDKWNDASARTAAYLTWPDARLRAYLREHGVNDSKIPGTRTGLLQETRIRWVQTHNKAEAMFLKIREIVNGGVGRAEDALQMIASLVTTGKDKLYHGYENTAHAAAEGADAHNRRVSESEQWAESKAETIKAKLKGEL